MAPPLPLSATNAICCSVKHRSQGGALHCRRCNALLYRQRTTTLVVALVKLAHIVSVVVGVALWSYGALMLVLASASAASDVRMLWSSIGALQDVGGLESGVDLQQLLHVA
ncbi:paraquat-inducible protein A [Paraburkholderia bengalensis]|uniref:paraquat-inducible protein A n=1 Tax=Paraburkholderia bengalensis TaxID=2747562 RepID=UPI003AF6FB46